jgi:KaiC/GvpD/RAD55 family RecA-like ATPase
LSTKSKRVSVDTLAALTLQFPDTIRRREVILELFEAVSSGGATAVITDEIRERESKPIKLEEYLADGLIMLRSSQVERRQVRMIEVEKIKASAIDEVESGNVTVLVLDTISAMRHMLLQERLRR